MRKSCLDYPVEIVDSVFSDGDATLVDLLRKLKSGALPRVLLVADQSVVSASKDLGTKIGRWVQAHGVVFAANPLLVAGGERIKQYDKGVVGEVVNAMVSAKIGADDVVLALGGGSLLDVVGWAAAQVRGGVPVVRLPTTPVAMFESAFATYAALDCPNVKDAMRVKTSPAGVVIGLDFAQSVLDGVWLSGFAVAMRQALVSDAPLVKTLVKRADDYRQRNPDAFKELVTASVAARQKKSDTDFALWAAHRLEGLSDYRLPYGYAVALGVAIVSSYAVLKGVMSEKDRTTMYEALVASGVMDAAIHCRYMPPLTDEKMLFGLDAWHLVTGSDAFVLPTGLGKSVVEEAIDRDTMKRAVNLIK